MSDNKKDFDYIIIDNLDTFKEHNRAFLENLKKACDWYSKEAYVFKQI